MKPGVDFFDFEVLSSEAPDPSSFDLACKLCWPSGLAAETREESDEEGLVTSSSSDSRSSGPAEDSSAA